MADDNVQATPEQADTSQAEDTAKVFPADYVQSLRQEAAGYRTKLREFEESQKQAQQERLAQQNEWKTLAEQRQAEIEQLKDYQERYNAMIDNIKANNEKRLEGIPDTMRSLVPPIDDPATLGQWLDANWQILTAKPNAPSLNGGAGSAPARTANIALSDAELDMARKMGLTAEQYAAAKVTR